MRKSIEVPLSTLIEVADIIVENELSHEIIAADESAETVTLEITYRREEREVIHQIEDFVEDNIEENES